MMMMRIIADMFAKASSNFGNFPATNYNQMQQGQIFFQTSQRYIPHHPHQSSYNMLNNLEEQEEDSIYPYSGWAILEPYRLGGHIVPPPSVSPLFVVQLPLNLAC